MNLNCYDYSPKEERKFIQDFIDDADFMASEMRNLHRLKKSKLDDLPVNEVTDMERWHLDDLENLIDSAEDLAHSLRKYKEDIC